MHPKDYFKNGSALKTLNTARKPNSFYFRFIQYLKEKAQKNSRKIIIGMLAFATLNCLIMIYLVNARPASSLIPSNSKAQMAIQKQKGNIEAGFSISNYITISKLKDSLDYLIKKPALSKSDSLLFIRICDEYTKLDPAFFKQVKQAIDKRKTNNHEKDNH